MTTQNNAMVRHLNLKMSLPSSIEEKIKIR